MYTNALLLDGARIDLYRSLPRPRGVLRLLNRPNCGSRRYLLQYPCFSTRFFTHKYSLESTAAMIFSLFDPHANPNSYSTTTLSKANKSPRYSLMPFPMTLATWKLPCNIACNKDSSIFYRGMELLTLATNDKAAKDIFRGHAKIFFWLVIASNEFIDGRILTRY